MPSAYGFNPALAKAVQEAVDNVHSCRGPHRRHSLLASTVTVLDAVSITAVLGFAIFFNFFVLANL